MSSSALPPLGNLPSWSRVSTLDRSRYPKPFLRDRLQTLPPPGAASDVGSTSFPMDLQVLDNLSASEQQHLVYYDKSIKFLQHQHADTLKKLHEEIEKLKQENKDLQFKYVMGKVVDPQQDRNSSSMSENDDEEVRSSTGADIQSMMLQEEVKDLRLALKNAQGRNAVLQHALQVQDKRKSSSKVKASASVSPADSFFSPTDKSTITSTHSSLQRDPSYLTVDEQERPLPFGATLNPLRIRSSPSVAPRSPSVEECEVIIKYLHRLSARQTEENQLLKLDLRQLLFPHQMTSSHRIGSNTKSEDLVKLPKVSFKDNLPNSKPQSGSNPDRVFLPALKQTINTNIAERKKRQQALQKTRKRDSSYQV